MKDDIYGFLDYISLEKNYSSHTETNYEEDLYKYEMFLNKNKLNYINVKYKQISKYILFLRESGYKSTSINRMLSSLRSFYNYLEKNNRVKVNPFGLIPSLKTEQRLPNYFKYNEFISMIESLGDSDLDVRNRLLLEMLLATGIRVSELVNIKLSDIDFSNCEIRVFGKGSKERIVFYGSFCKDYLDKYLSFSRSNLLNEKSSDYLFINGKGGKLTDRGVRFILENIVSKASIKSKVSPHTFRHTFATIMLNEGCNIKSVQEILGHASLSTTSIYTHLTNEEIRKSYLSSHPRAKK